MTAFVVPCVSPSGSARHIDSPSPNGFPRAARDATRSSVRSWSAKCAFPSPGHTCSPTCPAWQAKHDIDQRPLASTTYCSGFVGSSGRGVKP